VLKEREGGGGGGGGGKEGEWSRVLEMLMLFRYLRFDQVYMYDSHSGVCVKITISMLNA